MQSLPVFVKLSDQPVILLGDGEAADAKRRLIERAGGRVVAEDHPCARLAFVALEDQAAAEAAVARLKRRGLLVNAVDRPALCDFTTPAIIDRDPVIIAIGSGGASAGLAKALRQRLEALLPARLGDLARGLLRARPAMKARWPGAADRRRAIDLALAEGGALDPLAAHEGNAVDGWLCADTAAPAKGERLIRLRSLDPDDLTLAEARWLGQADIIVHDAAVPPAILMRARADAARVLASDAPALWPDDDVPVDDLIVRIHAP